MQMQPAEGLEKHNAISVALMIMIDMKKTFIEI